MSSQNTPDRAELRDLVAAVLPTDSDFEAFCSDHFSSTKRRFGNGMDRVAKTTMLLEVESPAELVAALHKFAPERFAKHRSHAAVTGHEQNQPSPHSSSSSSSVSDDGEGFDLLKNPGKRFVGRKDELKVLRSGLRNAAMRIGVVTGPGGSGKSSILYRLASGNLGQFRSRLCIDCNGSPEATQVLARISNWLQGHGNHSLAAALRNPHLNMKDKLPVAVRALEDSGPYLLGLDNFEAVLAPGAGGLEQADEHLSLLLSLLARGLRRTKVLIASRERFALDAPPGSVVWVPLDDLPQEEAIRIMQGLPKLGKQGKAKDFTALWEAGVRSPGLIDLVEASLQDYDLVEVISNVQHRLHGAMVATQQLDRIYLKLSANAQTLLMRISTYREPVPLEMLTVHLLSENQEYHEPLKALLDRSLLNSVDIKIGDTNRKFYRMPETARQWAEKRLRASEGDVGVAQAQRRAGYAYLAQLDKLPPTHFLPVVISGWQLLHYAGETLPAGRLAVALSVTMSRRIHPDFAQKAMEETLGRLQKSNDHRKLEASCLLQLGRIHHQQGRYALAQDHFERALSIGREASLRTTETASLSSLATLEAQQGKPELARAHAMQSLQLSLELGEPSRIAVSHCAMAMVEQTSLNMAEATQHYLKALNHAGEPLPKQQESGVSNTQNEEEDSIDEKIINNTLDVLRLQNDVFLVMDISTRLVELFFVNLSIFGNTATIDNPWKQMDALCDSLLSLSSNSNDIAALSQVMALKALLEFRQGNQESFRALMDKSITLSKGQGNIPSAAAKIAVFAGFEHDSRHYDSARSKYIEYLELTKQLGGTASLATIFCQGRLAVVEHILGNRSAARAYLLQTIAACQQLSVPSSHLPLAVSIGVIHCLRQIEAAASQPEEAQRSRQEWTEIIEQASKEAESQGRSDFASNMRQQLVAHTQENPIVTSGSPVSAN